MLSPEAVLRAASLELEISVNDIVNSGRYGRPTLARRVVAVVLKEEGYSWPEIGLICNRSGEAMRDSVMRGKSEVLPLAMAVKARTRSTSFEVVQEKLETVGGELVVWSIRNRVTGDGEFLPAELVERIYAFLGEKNLL